MEYKNKSTDSNENEFIILFMRNPAHSSLISTVIHNPSEENKRLIVSTFQKFIFQIRFTKYLSSLIRFADIEYHRKRKRIEERNQLIFDKPISDQSDFTLGEHLLQRDNYQDHYIPPYEPEMFLASIENTSLHVAFSKLTERQKYVITLAYSACELDTEIAQTLEVSQQAVTKTRLLALNKMRKFLEDNLSTGKGVI